MIRHIVLADIVDGVFWVFREPGPSSWMKIYIIFSFICFLFPHLQYLTGICQIANGSKAKLQIFLQSSRQMVHFFQIYLLNCFHLQQLRNLILDEQPDLMFSFFLKSDIEVGIESKIGFKIATHLILKVAKQCHPLFSFVYINIGASFEISQESINSSVSFIESQVDFLLILIFFSFENHLNFFAPFN